MEFLQFIAADFAIPTSGKSKSELLVELSNFVISGHQKGTTTVLVVDEAQDLSPDVIEELRLLTNLETPQAKLLQVLLIGQPELDAKLDSNELRQLKQRIVLRAHLGPLTLDETNSYIHSRLQLAGSGAPEEVFPMNSVLSIHHYSQGIPRLINTLCENALIRGHARLAHSVTPSIIEEIAYELRLHPPVSSGRGYGIGESVPGVEQAAQTLLDVAACLRAPDGRKDLRIVSESRVLS